MGSNLGELGFKTTIKTNAETSIQQLNDLVATAAKQAPTRLKNANAVIKERVKEIPDQLAKQAIGAGRVMDETVTNTKTLLNELNLMRAPAYADGVSTQAINTHFFENKITNMVNRFEGVNIGGTGVEKSINKTNQHLDDIVRDGSHILRDGTLKPNVKYQAGEYEYFYETDNIGRLKEFNADNLKLTERESRLPHNPKTPGKEPGDHAGHLAGDRFGGSPDLDNLVSQSSSVNLSKYKKLENQWAKAIEEGKDVSVNVRVNYEGNSLRPSGFDIEYEIDGRMRFTSIEN